MYYIVLYTFHKLVESSSATVETSKELIVLNPRKTLCSV